MKFKVQYTPMYTVAVDMVMIKIKNEELDLEETLQTNIFGVVASENKYAFGTKFTVEVAKVGWVLLTNVDEVTVTPDEKEITYEMKKKQFKLSFNVANEVGSPLQNVKIKISDGLNKMEELMTGANGKIETKNQYDFETKFTAVEVSKDGYKLETDLTTGITVGAEQSENVFNIVMSLKLVRITSYHTNFFVSHMFDYLQFKLKFMVEDDAGKPLANAKIKILNDKDEVLEELTTTLFPSTETSNGYVTDLNLKLEVSLDGYITAKKDVTVSAKESERSIPIKMTKETVSVFQFKYLDFT